ncbi:MAG: hypothetical protein PHP74_00080 [Candidatus Gracilibacteria bacterium]|nr:hypothetical protein [Candidatus Gracilibacteria bacterium]
MNDEFLKLIQSSQVLSPEKKQTYARILKFLSEKDKKTLFELLQKGQVSSEKIQENGKKEKSKLNSEYIREIENLYKNEMKTAISKEEKSDQSQADDVLKQI